MNGSLPDPVRPDRLHVTGTRIEDLLRDFLARAGELLDAQEQMRGFWKRWWPSPKT